MRHQPRSTSLVLAASALLWLPTVGSAQAPAKPEAPPSPAAKADPVVERLLEGHNKERAKEKLPPLQLEPKLTAAALEHAKDMAEHEKMGHEGSDMSTPGERVANAGYRYLRAGENVAAGYKDVAEVMLGWMDSPPHRKNIMSDYTEIGVARVVGKDNKPYWCVNFGKPYPKLDNANASKDLVKRLNDEREAAKLTTFVVDEKLAQAAQDRAASLAKKKSQGGETSNFEGIDQKPYAELTMSTANGHADAEAMASALLADPKVKGQILGKFTRIGTGYAVSEDGVPYWCLILARPTPSAPKKARR